jgi:hypothetical protein
MIIGNFDSFIINTGNNNCVKPAGKKYYQYSAQTGGQFVTGYGLTCEDARADWSKLASRKHYTLPPAKGGSNGGLSANSVKQAQAKGSSNTPASIFEPIFGTAKTGISASGKAGAGVTAGASISATVSDLQAKTDKVVSDVLPDSIESSIEGAGIPLWMLPVGIVGAGLLLILLVRR